MQNSLFNGYEEAAKQLGVTHGLRVFTTESIRVNPTSSVATVPQQEISSEPSSTVPAPVEDKVRIRINYQKNTNNTNKEKIN